MDIGIPDYVIFLLSSSAMLYSMYDALPKISSVTAISGMIATVWLVFILFHEEIPPLRNVFHSVFQKFRN